MKRVIDMQASQRTEVRPVEVHRRGRGDGRELVGRVLLGAAALGAVAAAGFAFSGMFDAGDDTRVLEMWRAAGLAVFGGLFALLAYRPRHYAGVWELVIANKLALAVFGIGFAAVRAQTEVTIFDDWLTVRRFNPFTTELEGVAELVVYDGALTVLLVAAYVLCRGWRAWASTR